MERDFSKLQRDANAIKFLKYVVTDADVTSDLLLRRLISSGAVWICLLLTFIRLQAFSESGDGYLVCHRAFAFQLNVEAKESADQSDKLKQENEHLKDGVSNSFSFSTLPGISVRILVTTRKVRRNLHFSCSFLHFSPHSFLPRLPSISFA